MRGAAPRRWPAAVFAAVLTVVPAAAFANPVSADDPPLLDVPYLAQPPELCGVAAVSMVLPCLVGAGNRCRSGLEAAQLRFDLRALQLVDLGAQHRHGQKH